MIEDERQPQPPPARPAHDRQATEKAMKAILLVATVVVGLPLLYLALMIGMYAMGT
ncbi:hypothetical protein ACFVFQ_13280 [Streptomyces sp. NPDC057743]|uniref:hypothetical protein n=1 Tax=Streptomyces sp. NPDC057743 TaxID=3346236 RepID=UPI0036916484